MAHKTKAERIAVRVRKGNNSKVRRTKVHTPKPVYDRKKKRLELESYLSQTSTRD